jgi:hypothetical protein
MSGEWIYLLDIGLVALIIVFGLDALASQSAR